MRDSLGVGPFLAASFLAASSSLSIIELHFGVSLRLPSLDPRAAFDCWVGLSFRRGFGLRARM